MDLPGGIAVYHVPDEVRKTSPSYWPENWNSYDFMRVMEEKSQPEVWFSDKFITRVLLNNSSVEPTRLPDMKAKITGWEYDSIDFDPGSKVDWEKLTHSLPVREKLSWNGFVWIISNRREDVWPRSDYAMKTGPQWRLGRWPD